MKPELLVLIALRGDAHRLIAASYDVHYAPTADERERAIARPAVSAPFTLLNNQRWRQADLDRPVF